ncbi:hypothetical protein RJ640_004894 [Escallonia rubra]|uniref:Uncharacterized protein n=1 Tax=Escallonia rubra TaxID=112253 RepID=A0AA88R5Z7_9ASTE|nr:hypothetical protein RJ640_004894 [Escallonia rubra]
METVPEKEGDIPAAPNASAFAGLLSPCIVVRSTLVFAIGGVVQGQGLIWITGHLKIPKEEEMTEGKRQTRKFAVPKLDINEIKNQTSAVQHVPSPVQRGGSAEQPSSSHSGTRTSNCLCSPTTHPGSFRCRLHRNVGLAQGGGSAGSSPSE